MGKNYKKYLRRMAAASVCAVVLCLVVMASATYALFHVSVLNEGNVFEVGRFEAESTIIAVTEDPAQTPATYASGEICPEGKYTLNVNWRGNVDGHIAVTVTPEDGVAALAADDETAAVPTDTVYVIDLPVASSISFVSENGEYSDTLQIPLAIHEPARVTVKATWGPYTPAEGEVVSPITMDDLALFLETGISSGTPFESSVTIREVEAESAEETEPVVELIGEKQDEAKVYEEDEYVLTISWTPKFDAYCVLDIVAADENSGVESQKFIITLPAADVAEDESAVLTIPVHIHEKAKLTASVVKGSTDNSREWFPDANIVFGTFFGADVTVDLLPVASDATLTALDEKKTYAAGDYRLQLDWTRATADGYCVITVGEDVYYVSGSVAEGADKDRIYMLKLLKDTGIAVTFKKGALPADVVEFTDETIVCGAEFKVDAFIAAASSEGDPVYNSLAGVTRAAGSYLLKLNWSGASADGYCVVSVGGVNYYVNCPAGQQTAERVITLELLKDAAVTVVTVPGAIPEGCEPLTADKVVYGAVFEGTAAIAPVPAEGEPVYAALAGETYAAGNYKLSLDWKNSTVDGYVLITVTVPAADGGEDTVVRYYLSGALEGKACVLDLILTDGATVQVDFVEGVFAGEAHAVPADGKITVPVPAAQPAAEEQE